MHWGFQESADSKDQIQKHTHTTTHISVRGTMWPKLMETTSNQDDTARERKNN